MYLSIKYMYILEVTSVDDKDGTYLIEVDRLHFPFQNLVIWYLEWYILILFSPHIVNTDI